jgi:DNA-binding transcriptional regulator YiaG
LPPTADETSSISNNASNAISHRQHSVGSASSSIQRTDISPNEARESDAEADQSNRVESVQLSQESLENWEMQAEKLENDALDYLQR